MITTFPNTNHVKLRESEKSREVQQECGVTVVGISDLFVLKGFEKLEHTL